MITQSKRLTVQSPLTCDTFFRGTENPSHLFILLHGYMQSGKYIARQLESALPKDAEVLALNGPFPIPRKSEEGLKLGYSWYFYNPKTDELVIDMKTSIDFVINAIAALGFESLPKTLIGYSQGGYLAPFVGQKLSGVTRLIALNAEVLDDELAGPLEFRIDSIHGAKDEIVNPKIARERHARLKARGVQGEFVELPESGHEITEEMMSALRNLAVTVKFMI
ncbi:hypothetical protein WDW86_10430 [Bdellovibrionota bacterium FG-2]